MTSIRRQLLAGLFGSVLVAATIAGVAVYFRAQDEAGTLLDYQLRQMALSLRDRALHVPDAYRPPPFDDDFDFAIEIRSADGSKLQYSRSRVELPSRMRRGHSTVNTAEGVWRMYTLQEPGFTVSVAQPMSVRSDLAVKAALRTLTPFLLLVPLLALLVWVAVTRGLRPLGAVANAV